MDRRDFLMSGSAVAVGTTLVGSTASGAEPSLGVPAVTAGLREIVVSMPAAFAATPLAEASARLARRLAEASGGRFATSVRAVEGGGIEAVTIGDADIALGTTAHDASHHPAFSVFAAMPVGEHLDAAAFNAWVQVGGGRDLADDLGRAFGVIVRIAGHTGSGGGLWSERRIARIDDFAGASLAVSGLGARLARALGAEAVMRSSHDMREDLKSGAILAAEPTFPSFAALASWAVHPGFLPGGTALSATLRSSLYDQLDTADRAVIDAVLAEENQRSLAGAFAARALAGDLERKQRQPHRLGLDRGMRHDLEAAARDVVSDLGRSSAEAGRIVDSYRAFRRLASGDGGLDSA
jgi:TRAP-type mannitol/chloroaromatic compound transport system substrate-binding protein